MDVLFKCFVTGLIAGIPVWILMQYARPRVGFAGLPVFGGSGPGAADIQPVVLNGRFVANVLKPQS
jgi:hypothetical protein